MEVARRAVEKAEPTADTSEVAVAVAALHFLSDENRLRILRRLAGREAYVFELADDLALPQPLVSYHLRRLREAGLVRPSRRAKRVCYALDAEAWDAFAQPIRDVCAMVERVAEEAAAADPVGTPTG
jgi:ArsR family transcriptional regulator